MLRIEGSIRWVGKEAMLGDVMEIRLERDGGRIFEATTCAKSMHKQLVRSAGYSISQARTLQAEGKGA